MALPTKFITSGQDLNTIFAAIAVNQIDYGVFSGLNIGETWNKPTLSTTQTTANNIALNTSGGFTVSSAGFYRLNITLNFGSTSASPTVKNVVFILSNSATLSGTGYSFTPSPKMSTIYAINCSGSNGYNGDVTNYLNNANLGNCLTLNPAQNTFSTDEYFFSFPVFCDGTQSNSNFFTLDITFKTFFNTGEDFQMIYPYIRCRDDPIYNATITLQNSKWIFTKINEIPS